MYSVIIQYFPLLEKEGCHARQLAGHDGVVQLTFSTSPYGFQQNKKEL